jgi:hypothetical protein
MRANLDKISHPLLRGKRLRFSTVLSALLALTLFLSCPAGRADLLPLIPRADLFGDPEKASVRISPDGKLLAYQAPADVGGQKIMNIWVKTLGKVAPG